MHFFRCLYRRRQVLSPLQSKDVKETNRAARQLVFSP
jgi:hypothetical protein